MDSIQVSFFPNMIFPLIRSLSCSLFSRVERFVSAVKITFYTLHDNNHYHHHRQPLLRHMSHGSILEKLKGVSNTPPRRPSPHGDSKEKWPTLSIFLCVFYHLWFILFCSFVFKITCALATTDMVIQMWLHLIIIFEM